METRFQFIIPEGSIVKTLGVPATAESPEIPRRTYPARKYLTDLVRNDLKAHVRLPKKDFDDFLVTTNTFKQKLRMESAAEGELSPFFKKKW